MQVKLYTILDRVAGVNAVMTLVNENMAKRMFADVVNEKKDGKATLNFIQKNPADYVLLELAEMETETGEITPTGVEVAEAIETMTPDIAKQCGVLKIEQNQN